MKIVKLGLEWGPAHEEATPIRITHGDSELIVFVSADHELIVQAIGASVSVFRHNGACGLEMKV